MGVKPLSYKQLIELKSHKEIKNDKELAGRIIAAKLARDQLLTSSTDISESKKTKSRLNLILKDKSIAVGLLTEAQKQTRFSGIGITNLTAKLIDFSNSKKSGERLKLLINLASNDFFKNENINKNLGSIAHSDMVTAKKSLYREIRKMIIPDKMISLLFSDAYIQSTSDEVTHVKKMTSDLLRLSGEFITDIVPAAKNMDPNDLTKMGFKLKPKPRPTPPEIDAPVDDPRGEDSRSISSQDQYMPIIRKIPRPQIKFNQAEEDTSSLNSLDRAIGGAASAPEPSTSAQQDGKKLRVSFDSITEEFQYDTDDDMDDMDDNLVQSISDAVSKLSDKIATKSILKK